MTEDKQVQRGLRDYDAEYAKGVHWEKDGKYSSNMPRFLKYLKDDEKILDAGCGSGRDVVHLVQQGYTVVGVDQSPVAISKAKVKEINQEKTDFQIGKIENLNFPDSTFDAAYSGYTLGGETFPEQISELSRVLKNKGILYIAMFTQTKYQKSDERDEVNPKEWIIENIEPYFQTVEIEEDSYDEEDDHGMHTHDRIRLALRNKKQLLQS